MENRNFCRLSAHGALWAGPCGPFALCRFTSAVCRLTFAVVAAFCFLLGCKKGNNSNPVQTDPQISVNDVSIVEGNGGSTNFEFIITLDKASSKQVSVNFSTQDGTAKSGEDYTLVNTPVIFQPNETEKKVIVPVVADDLKEGDDIFTVKIESPVNATISKQTGTGTIKNDDTKVPFTDAGYDAPTSYAGYTLAWSDEFNSPSVDAGVWTFETGDGCPNLCGWGNNELEYYTNRPDNLFFQDGKMIIEAKSESLGGKQYTSTRIKTEGKKTFKFGRIDIRAKLPKGKGIWPALWMLPQNNVYGGWPRSGEMDIMELVGHEPARIYSTVHYGPGPGSIQISRNYSLAAGNFNDEFHVFSVEWKQDQMKFYVDGNLFSTVNSTDFGANTYPFNEQFFFVANLAIGGNWPGSPDATTYFPQWLILDYIRVYQ